MRRPNESLNILLTMSFKCTHVRIGQLLVLSVDPFICVIGSTTILCDFLLKQPNSHETVGFSEFGFRVSYPCLNKPGTGASINTGTRLSIALGRGS